MPIRVLAPEVAALIAAGEVVEGPSSTVKELVENALDAGASAITVELQDGGRDLIRVVDNGIGILQEDASHLFQRHATSKLAAWGELEEISTLGFRGEALYSLAAVASVALLTRPEGADGGTYLEVHNGRVLRQEPRGAPRGTSVTVRHLFQEVPARRKFLRSAQAELGRVQRLLARYVLAYPEVRFTLTADGRTLLAAPGNGQLREAMRAIYGASVTQGLLEIASSKEGRVGVAGLVSPPGLHRANRSSICLLVNHRPVQSRTLTYALVEAYHGLLPAGRSPVAVVSLTIPYEDVDVNVHPAKAEVRFRRESEVFAALQQTVRQTLVAQAPVPALDPTSLTMAQDLRISGSFATIAQTPKPKPWYTLPRSQARELTPPTDGVTSREEELPWESQQALPLSRTLPALRVIGQVQETYIVAEGPGGMYLIDQHAAHECVVYERLRDAAAGHSPNAQGLLDSVVVELSLQQTELVEAQREVLERYGWQLEAFGAESYLIRAVPAVLTQKGPSQALVDLTDALLAEEPSKPWEERVMATLACHGAVRAGMPLTQAEMTEMVRLLEQTQQPHTCPHGRPTMVRLSTSHLEREFRRR